MIKILAPAKINLTLEVLGRRPDGYHEIRSILQTISLYDELTFEVSGEISLSSQGIPIEDENLMLKAARLLKEAASVDGGARMTLKKAIPVSGGLGGGSSDAAATLTALNQLWQLGLSKQKLLELAATLGSDVPFFMYGGTALAEGRGERVKRLAAVNTLWVLLLISPIPTVANKTQMLYRSLTQEDFTDGTYTSRMQQYLEEKKSISEELLFNVFESVAFSFFPDLDKYKQEVLKAGVKRVNLAGSGPVLYSIFFEESEAVKLYNGLLQGGNKVFLVKSVNPHE
jgi:4-diphosphocytidyl-2-C-methyl-D-erythritol kinase